MEIEIPSRDHHTAAEAIRMRNESLEIRIPDPGNPMRRGLGAKPPPSNFF